MPIVDPVLSELPDSHIARAIEVLKETDRELSLSWSAFATAATHAAGQDPQLQKSLAFCARLFAIELSPPGSRKSAAWNPPSWSDIAEEEVPFIRTLLDRFTDPDARARFAHLLWLRTRDHRMAEAAVGSYLEAGALVESPATWPACIDRYATALHLASSFSKGRPPYTQVLDRLKAVLTAYAVADTSFLSLGVMRLLFDQDAADVTVFSQTAEEIARRLESEEKYHAAREYLQLKIDCERSRDPVAAKAAEGTFAKVFENEALSQARKGQFTAAVNSFQCAVQYLSKCGGHTSEVLHLRRLLAEHGPKALAEIEPISASIPIDDLVSVSQNAVRGKDFRGALFALAKISRPPKLAVIRKNTIDGVRQFPLQHLFGLTLLTSDGSAPGRRASIDPNDPERDEDALRGEMVRQSAIRRGIAVMGGIVPAWRALLEEHAFSERDLLPFMHASPFVPPGREEIYAKGLWAGFDGDFLVATHVLIPQLENSIRFVLAQRGLPVVKAMSGGIDEQKTFSALLALSETSDALGEDLVFDLLAVLDHRLGPNFRNALAHGLFPPSAFVSQDAVYVWWLILRIALLPLMLSQPKQNGSGSSAASANSEVF